MCIKGMSGHWTSRIFQGLVTEYFNSFLRPTAYDRKEDEHTKRKKRFSNMKKLKSLGKSMREERQRRGSVTQKLVRAGKLVRRLSSPWLSPSPPTSTGEEPTLSPPTSTGKELMNVEEEASSSPRRSIFRMQGKFVVPSPMRSIRKMRDSLLSTPLSSSFGRKSPFSFDPKSTSTALRSAREEEEEEKEKQQERRRRRRQKRRCRRGSNVLGVVVRRDLKIQTSREDSILEKDVYDDDDNDYVRDKDCENVMQDTVEKDQESFECKMRDLEHVDALDKDSEGVMQDTIEKDKEHYEHKIRELKAELEEMEDEEQEEEMEPPPGLNYVMKKITKDDTRSEVRFEDSSEQSVDICSTRTAEKKSNEQRVMFERKEEKSSSKQSIPLFRKRKNDLEKQKGSVLELFGVDERDISTRIKSRYNRSGKARSQSQRKITTATMKKGLLSSRSLALRALQPMMDVLGRSPKQRGAKLSRPETALSSSEGGKKYLRLEKLIDWKQKNKIVH